MIGQTDNQILILYVCSVMLLFLVYSIWSTPPNCHHQQPRTATVIYNIIYISHRVFKLKISFSSINFIRRTTKVTHIYYIIHFTLSSKRSSKRNNRTINIYWRSTRIRHQQIDRQFHPLTQLISYFRLSERLLM